MVSEQSVLPVNSGAGQQGSIKNVSGVKPNYNVSQATASDSYSASFTQDPSSQAINTQQKKWINAAGITALLAGIGGGAWLLASRGRNSAPVRNTLSETTRTSIPEKIWPSRLNSPVLTGRPAPPVPPTPPPPVPPVPPVPAIPTSILTGRLGTLDRGLNRILPRRQVQALQEQIDRIYHSRGENLRTVLEDRWRYLRQDRSLPEHEALHHIRQILTQNYGFQPRQLETVWRLLGFS